MPDYAPLILVIIAVFLLLRATSRARRGQREILERQAAVRAGDRVVTTSGLYGTVVEVADDTVVLETGPGQHSTWAKGAVGEILTSALAPADVRPEGPEGTGGTRDEAAGG